MLAALATIENELDEYLRKAVILAPCTGLPSANGSAFGQQRQWLANEAGYTYPTRGEKLDMW